LLGVWGIKKEMGEFMVNSRVNRGKKIPECWKCRVDMELYEDEIDGVKFNTWRCPRCGESITTLPQLHELATKYREERKKMFKVTVSEWGGNVGIRIPRELAEKYSIDVGEKVLLLEEEQGIKMMPE